MPIPARLASRSSASRSRRTPPSLSVSDKCPAAPNSKLTMASPSRFSLRRHHPTPRQLEIIGPPPQACRDELLTIVRNSDFSGSDRDRKFLEYIVEEALARRKRIKAFSVAVEVFGRDASFDPQSDPIVRVRAGHLRRALERYYEGPGRTDPAGLALALDGGSSGPARPHPEMSNAISASNAKGTARRNAEGLEIGINVETPNRRRRYSEKRRGCERRLDRSSNVPGGRAIPRGR